MWKHYNKKGRSKAPALVFLSLRLLASADGSTNSCKTSFHIVT
ncbi:MAG: hypothetical protein FD128_263, partial [Hyphomonadaceae bacterium]